MNDYILLGLKDERHITGDNTNWTSVNTTGLDIIKTDSLENLIKFVDEQKHIAKKAAVQLDALYERIEFNNTIDNITEKQYTKLVIKYTKQCSILKYAKLMAVKGIIL